MIDPQQMQQQPDPDLQARLRHYSAMFRVGHHYETYANAGKWNKMVKASERPPKYGTLPDLERSLDAFAKP